VLLAYLFAAVPALFAGLAYAILASAMPRAGGSYVYASRALSPYLGFVASFSQWFGLCIAIGVVSLVLIPFLRDIAVQLKLEPIATALDAGVVRLTLALAVLWTFVVVNLLGLRSVPTYSGPANGPDVRGGRGCHRGGFRLSIMWTSLPRCRHGEMRGRQILGRSRLRLLPLSSSGPFLPASVLLFSSFIRLRLHRPSLVAKRGIRPILGRSPSASRCWPWVRSTCSSPPQVYHAIPWRFVAEQAVGSGRDGARVVGLRAFTGLDGGDRCRSGRSTRQGPPAMIFTVSRLMFAWAADGIFPRAVAKVHVGRHTPHVAITLSGIMASLAFWGVTGK